MQGDSCQQALRIHAKQHSAVSLFSNSAMYGCRTWFNDTHAVRKWSLSSEAAEQSGHLLVVPVLWNLSLSAWRWYVPVNMQAFTTALLTSMTVLSTVLQHGWTFPTLQDSIFKKKPNDFLSSATNNQDSLIYLSTLALTCCLNCGSEPNSALTV